MILKGDLCTQTGQRSIVFRLFNSSFDMNTNQDLRVMFERQKLPRQEKNSLFVTDWFTTDAFIRTGGICKQYLPFKWSDMLDIEDLSGRLLTTQFYLLLVTLDTLHRMGIANGSFTISNVLLNHGLIPYMNDFSFSWTEERKIMTQEELQHLDPLYVSEELRAAFKIKGTIPMSLERAKS